MLSTQGEYRRERKRGEKEKESEFWVSSKVLGVVPVEKNLTSEEETNS